MTDPITRRMPITGPPHLVRATLETQQRKGVLVTDPRRISLRRNTDGTVTADVTLMVAESKSWRERHPVMFPVAGLALAGVGLTSAGLALFFAFSFALGTIPYRPGVFGVLALIAVGIMTFMRRRRSDCPGVVVHCRDHKH